MKNRILMALCILMLIIMTSGTTVFAAGFAAPEDGASVLVNEPVEGKFVVSFTAANNQTYCNITVEDPKGETSEVFASDSVYENFEADINFTPTEEGTYKITAVTGTYINMMMGIFSSKYQSPVTTDTISVKAVKTLPAAAEDKSVAASGKDGKDSDASASSEGTKKDSEMTDAENKTTTGKKKANTMTVKAKSKTIKVSLKTLKKKNVTVKVKNAFTVKKAIGKVTYKKTAGSKKITVSKAGKITVKKGLKKGNYKIKVKVTAAGNKSYKAKSKTVALTITVKY